MKPKQVPLNQVWTLAGAGLFLIVLGTLLLVDGIGQLGPSDSSQTKAATYTLEYNATLEAWVALDSRSGRRQTLPAGLPGPVFLVPPAQPLPAADLGTLILETLQKNRLKISPEALRSWSTFTLDQKPLFPDPKALKAHQKP